MGAGAKEPRHCARSRTPFSVMRWICRSLLVTAVLELLLRGTTGAKSELHLSSDGADSPQCGGSITTPCRSLHTTLRKASLNATIHLRGNIKHNCGRSALHLRGRIRILGQGDAVISCHRRGSPGPHPVLLSLSNSALLLDNVTIAHSTLLLRNAHLSLRHTHLLNATLESFGNSRALTLTAQSSRFSRTEGCINYDDCSIFRGFPLAAERLMVHLSRCEFRDLSLSLFGSRQATISVHHTVFTKKLRAETFQGGLNVTLPMTRGVLRVQDCDFSELRHFDPVLSAINIEAAALRVQSHRQTLGGTETSSVLIKSTVFSNNERAISISRPLKSVEINNCTFLHNNAMHGATAIRLAVDKNHSSKIINCMFVGNSAGFLNHIAVPRRFNIGNNEIRIESKQYKGVLILVGKGKLVCICISKIYKTGGALRIQRGNATVHNCIFSNNSASRLGGSIYVDRKSAVVLSNSHLENTFTGQIAIQGDILYSNGHVDIKNTSFHVITAKDHVTLLRHSGDHWSMNVESLYFRCPISHRLAIVNATSTRIVSKVGLMRSHKLDQLSYFCQLCGSNQYSLKYGYLNYTLTDPNGNSSEYYTLRIDGQSPFKTHSVKYDYGNITCMDCSYGGRCQEGLAAVPNFWGYYHGSHVFFQHCPPDYCCDTTDCPSINECAPHRDGVLCGRCIDGYSEALFSVKCISNKSCSKSWALSLFCAAIGLCYAVFLVFQRDLRGAVFKWDWHFCRNGRLKHARPEQEATGEESVPLESTTDVNGSVVSGCDNAGLQNHRHSQPKSREQPTQEAGFLIILFYYFQDALLLHVDTVYAKAVSQIEKQLKALLLGLFRFQLDFFQFIGDICLYPNLHPVGKTLFRAAFVPYIMGLFGLFYLLSQIMERTLKRCHPSEERNRSIVSRILRTLQSTRLSAGFTLCMMFTYQKLATTAFALLNCVPVAGQRVLFLDGTVQCFQQWQYGVMVYAFSCVLPFSVVLMVGPPLLRVGLISLTGFFLGCACPLPFLALWVWRIRRFPQQVQPQEQPPDLCPNTRGVLDVLQGPFKEPESKRFVAQLCWAGVLMIRRLALFLCFTFINDVLLRLLSMNTVCFVILCHHMYVQPYSSQTGNLAGALSAAALMVIGAMNLVRAAFESAEAEPAGPNKQLLLVFEELENVLVLWFPILVFGVFAFCTIVRLSMHILSGILHASDSQSTSDDASKVDLIEMNRCNDVTS